MIPFFRASGGRIEAAAGLKGLALPGDTIRTVLEQAEAGDIWRDLEGLDQSGWDSASLVEQVSALLGIEHPAFEEEASHFRCVLRSRRAFALHIRNFATRLIYSYANRRHPIGLDPTERPEFCEVLRYHQDAADFFLSASPWIEALHLVEGGGSPETQADDPEVARAASLLSELGQVDPGIVARHIDSGGRLDRRPATDDPEPSEGLRSWGAVMESLFPLLRFPQLYYLGVRTVWNTRRSLPRYLRSRISGDAGQDRSLGQIPGVLAPGLTIDPAAFGQGQTFHQSQELGPEDPTSKAESDLVWFLLRVSGTSVQMFRARWSEAKVRAFWARLQDFYSRWSPDATEAEGVLVRSGGMTLRRLRAPETWRDPIPVALEVYRVLRHSALDLTAPPVRAALNCHYMHV